MGPAAVHAQSWAIPTYRHGRPEGAAVVLGQLNCTLILSPQARCALHGNEMHAELEVHCARNELDMGSRTSLAVWHQALAHQASTDLALHGRHQRVLLLQEARGHPAQPGVLVGGGRREEGMVSHADGSTAG